MHLHELVANYFVNNLIVIMLSNTPERLQFDVDLVLIDLDFPILFHKISKLLLLAVILNIHEILSIILDSLFNLLMIVALKC